MKYNLIGVSGRIKSGKDLVGDILNYLSDSDNPNYIEFKNLYDDENIRGKYTIVKYAEKLKQCACLLLGCTRAQFEDQDFKNAELGEEWWVHEIQPNFGYGKKIIPYTGDESEKHLTIIKLTPRKLLQLLGSECGRDIIHPNIWVNSLFSNYKSGYIEQGVGWVDADEDYPDWIITDVRYPKNEGKAITKRGGIVIGVKRYFHLRYPEYKHLVDKDNPYNIPLELKNVNLDLWKSLTYESETIMGDYSWCDHIITNNGTMEDLFNELLANGINSYDFINCEVKETKENFDLDEILDFQLKHDVQIIRGEDYQYLCYIDKKGYGVSLTPISALVFGIKQYKEHFDKKS